MVLYLSHADDFGCLIAGNMFIGSEIRTCELPKARMDALPTALTGLVLIGDRTDIKLGDEGLRCLPYKKGAYCR